MMRRTVSTLLLIAGVGIAASSTSFAADLGNRQIYKAPAMAPATFSWTGFYIGAHVGYGWGDSDWSEPGASLSVKNDGFIGGGQIGYNWQVAPTWVLGLEGDISGSGISTSDCNGTCTNDINWLATITGRVGYTFDRAMIYGKGGAAFADQKIGVPGYSSSATRTGWTVGGGLEYAFAPQWSAKVEYNYMDFGSKSFDGVSVDQSVNALKVGVNYRFGGL